MCLNISTWETNYPDTGITLNRASSKRTEGIKPLCGISLRLACTKEYELLTNFTIIFTFNTGQHRLQRIGFFVVILLTTYIFILDISRQF